MQGSTVYHTESLYLVRGYEYCCTWCSFWRFEMYFRNSLTACQCGLSVFCNSPNLFWFCFHVNQHSPMVLIHPQNNEDTADHFHHILPQSDIGKLNPRWCVLNWKPGTIVNGLHLSIGQQVWLHHEASPKGLSLGDTRYWVGKAYRLCCTPPTWSKVTSVSVTLCSPGLTLWVNDAALWLMAYTSHIVLPSCYCSWC